MKLTAQVVADGAQPWLARTNCAQVLSAHDRALNFINEGREIFSVVTQPRAMNPLAALVLCDDERAFAAVTSASRARIEANAVCVEDVEINFDAAKTWDARPNWSAIQIAFAKNPQYLRAGAFCGAPVHMVSEQIRRVGADFAAALVAGDEARAHFSAMLLAGLGAGLTPSGDDYVCGAFLACWALGFAPDWEPAMTRIGEAISSRTTYLSAAFVRAAARGECMIQWHDVFDGVIGGDSNELSRALGELICVGHTSGADMLAGFTAVAEQHELHR